MDTKSKILIVDDDENITELIALYLEKEGYTTRSVNNGSDAIHVFNAFFAKPCYSGSYVAR